MKVVLLAGGFGTRLAEYTDSIPKPMVPIGRRPILWHIMQHYASFGHKDFYLALGYKAEVVKEYFLNYRALNADFTVDLRSGSVTPYQLDEVDWRVTLVDTGLQTMTGGRVKRMQPFIGDETFLLTYGDGVANINLDALLAFHRKHGKMVTVTVDFNNLHGNARDHVLRYISGLPFTSRSNNKTTAVIGYQRGLRFVYGNDVFFNQAGRYHTLYGYIGGSTTNLSLNGSMSYSPYSGWPATHNSSSSQYMRITISYFTD